LSALFGGLCGGCRIIEISMDESNGSAPTRATLFGAIAHRDYIVDGLRRILCGVLESVMGDVDPDLGHASTDPGFRQAGCVPALHTS